MNASAFALTKKLQMRETFDFQQVSWVVGRNQPVRTQRRRRCEAVHRCGWGRDSPHLVNQPQAYFW